jgi:acetoin:2,6-dichlorophenolindophenol oxidoreductase subunit alpha
VTTNAERRDVVLYRKMRFIRRFEETLLALFEQGLLQGTTHACIGQEADSVGVMEHVEDGDHVFSNHRCHGHYLARTGDAVGLLAEIMGKRSGICAGIGGSQHICSRSAGFKSNGIQGGIVPTAAGIAMAEQLKGSDRISLVFIGDGTLGEGLVYETMNMAALWKLPLFVVLEDNGWSQSTPLHLNLAGSMRARFEAFGLPVKEIDTTDVLEVDRAAKDEIGRMRKERGPRVLIIHTYRLCHHSKSDDARPAEEIAARWKIEPLVVHGARLSQDEIESVNAEIDQAMLEVVAKARSLP